jgi:hypothetical protein
MIANLLNRLARFEPLPVPAQEDQDIALQKRLLFGTSVIISIAGVVWGSLYVAFHEIFAAMVPYGYSLWSLVSAVVYVRTRDIDLLRKAQLGLILVCPTVLMLVLGGFHPGSVVFIWAIMAPFGALLYHKPEYAPRWLALYLLALVLSAVAQPFLATENLLPEGLVTVFYALNIGMVSIIAFALLYYFVRGKNQAMAMLRRADEPARDGDHPE